MKFACVSFVLDNVWIKLHSVGIAYVTLFLFSDFMLNIAAVTSKGIFSIKSLEISKKYLTEVTCMSSFA